MVAGIVGILLPVLPGLLVIWAAGLWWTIADGGGPVRWTVFACMTVLLAVGTTAKYVLPARSAAARGAPFATLVVGGDRRGGRLLRDPDRRPDRRRRARDLPGRVRRGCGTAGRAWDSTRAALVAIGIGMLDRADRRAC